MPFFALQGALPVALPFRSCHGVAVGVDHLPLDRHRFGSVGRRRNTCDREEHKKRRKHESLQYHATLLLGDATTQLRQGEALRPSEKQRGGPHSLAR